MVQENLTCEFEAFNVQDAAEVAGKSYSPSDAATLSTLLKFSTDFDHHALSILESPLVVLSMYLASRECLSTLPEDQTGETHCCVAHLAVAQHRHFDATNYNSGTAYKSMSGELLGGH